MYLKGVQKICLDGCLIYQCMTWCRKLRCGNVWALKKKNQTTLNSRVFFFWSCMGLPAPMDSFGHLPSAILGAPSPNEPSQFKFSNLYLVLRSEIQMCISDQLFCSCIWNSAVGVTKLSCWAPYRFEEAVFPIDFWLPDCSAPICLRSKPRTVGFPLLGCTDSL